MNVREFTNELNKLIARAMSEGVDKRQMDPSNIIGALELQKTQLVMQLVAIAAAKQNAELAKSIIPAQSLNGLKPPGLS